MQPIDGVEIEDAVCDCFGECDTFGYAGFGRGLEELEEGYGWCCGKDIVGFLKDETDSVFVVIFDGTTVIITGAV